MTKNDRASVVFSDTKPHYELLDGLRGVAALLVVWYHVFEGFSFAEVCNSAGNGLIKVLNHGYLAVDFFFMLSGFVISYAYDDRWEKMSVGEFFKRRLIRLHPMLVMATAIGTIAFCLGGCVQWNGEVVAVKWILVALCLTMCMIPAVPGASYEIRGNGELFPLNGPTWSLFFEYIGNILYALVIRRFSTGVLTVLVVLLGGGLAWFGICDVSGYGNLGVGWTLDTVNFWGGLLRMLFPFTFGMLLARKFKPIRIKGAFWLCSFLLVVLFSVPYIQGGEELCYNGMYELFCIMVMFPMIVWLGASGKSTDSNTRRVNQFLGDLSYPLYVVHYPIMYLFYAWLIEQELYTLKETWWICIGVVALSILLASVCLKCYDEPVRKWLLRRFVK